MQGIWIMGDGADAHLARTKTEVRKVLDDLGPGHIFLERTVAWEYDGMLLLAPRDVDHWCVGPDPQQRRHWYGCFHWDHEEGRWLFR